MARPPRRNVAATFPMADGQASAGRRQADGAFGKAAFSASVSASASLT